jgi:hypothetical protein
VVSFKRIITHVLRPRTGVRFVIALALGLKGRGCTSRA